MSDHRKVRSKTQESKLVAEVERQKSIFKNLSWQVKQKDRKISFLERYYVELQQMITRQKKEDASLLQRAQEHIKKRRKDFIHKSTILKSLDQSSRKHRIITEAYDNKQNEEENMNDFLQDDYYARKLRLKR